MQGGESADTSTNATLYEKSEKYLSDYLKKYKIKPKMGLVHSSVYVCRLFGMLAENQKL